MNYFVITRPLEQERIFVERLLAQAAQGGVTALDHSRFIFSPMLEIAYLCFELPALGGFSGVLLSSAQAVEALCAMDRDDDVSSGDPRFTALFALPVYVVGQRTAEKAKAAGFSNVVCVAETASDLDQSLPDGHFLYLSGQDIRHDFHGDARRRVTRLVVYEARLAEDLSPPLLAALRANEVGAVSFFSVRSARNFVELVAKNGLTYSLASVGALCISEAVLECIRPDWSGPCFVSDTPDSEGMIDLLLGSNAERDT
ncbi:MAG: uroporphyrinogen-III synthase [Alphaproteobacteria bacterium]|nr:uroporphyrinogen-III synthase [Alphaproteobacteria bacterium]